MKLKIQLQDPDGVYDSLTEAAGSSLPDDDSLSQDELEALTESRRQKLEQQCKPWIKHAEIVVIEIDTEAGTATVCKA